jgi:transposase
MVATAEFPKAPGTRQTRGLALARDRRIKPIAGTKWYVPSATQSSGGYVVDVAEGSCSCPDWETNGSGHKCKHAVAVEFVMRSVTTHVDGSTTETTVKVKYTQDWPIYNAAATHEKEHVGVLLSALCEGVQNPPQKTGRPRLALADLIHSAAMKIYAKTSGRNSATDMRFAHEKGLIDRTPHYNSVHALMEDARTTGLLKNLVEESALPLKALETQFAVDSTGFSSNVYARWFDHKYGREMKEHTWVKCHAMAGVTTHVITSVEVTPGHVNDCPILPQLVYSTAKNGWHVAEVSADMGYVANANLEAIESIGAIPYIPFKSNNQGMGPDAWRRAFAFFTYKKPEFLAQYHARSNVETVFSMIKAKFGGNVKAKIPVAQTNEVLLKCLVHNLARVNHCMYAFGVKPEFWVSAGQPGALQ